MLKTWKSLWMSGLKKAAKTHRKQVRGVLKALVAPMPKAAKSGKPRSTASSPAKRKTARSGNPAKASAAAGDWGSGYHRPVTDLTRRLHYRLFLPAGLVADAPLLVMLHGCRQDAAVFAEGTGMNALAAARGMAVLYPEQALRGHPHRCWRWYEQAALRGGGDVAALAGMVDEVADRLASDRQRIYVCGLSAGAAMAQLLAFSHPERFAALGIHSGPVVGSATSATSAFKVMQLGTARPETTAERWLARDGDFPGMPAIMLSGANDDVVRPVNQRQLETQLLRLNQSLGLLSAPVQHKPFGRVSRQHPVKRSMVIQDHLHGRRVMLRTVLIDGLGHAWSGGDPALPYNAAGPDASRMMLDFFARHRRRRWSVTSAVRSSC